MRNETLPDTLKVFSLWISVFISLTFSTARFAVLLFNLKLPSQRRSFAFSYGCKALHQVFRLALICLLAS